MTSLTHSPPSLSSSLSPSLPHSFLWNDFIERKEQKGEKNWILFGEKFSLRYPNEEWEGEERKSGRSESGENMVQSSVGTNSFTHWVIIRSVVQELNINLAMGFSLCSKNPSLSIWSFYVQFIFLYCISFIPPFWFSPSLSSFYSLSFCDKKNSKIVKFANPFPFSQVLILSNPSSRKKIIPTFYAPFPLF